MGQKNVQNQNLKRGKGGYGNYYCPTCATPREKQKFPLPDELETYYCLNCNAVLAFGYLLSLKVTCPKYGRLVKAG